MTVRFHHVGSIKDLVFLHLRHQHAPTVSSQTLGEGSTSFTFLTSQKRFHT